VSEANPKEEAHGRAEHKGHPIVSPSGSLHFSILMGAAQLAVAQTVLALIHQSLRYSAASNGSLGFRVLVGVKLLSD